MTLTPENHYIYQVCCTLGVLLDKAWSRGHRVYFPARHVRGSIYLLSIVLLLRSSFNVVVGSKEAS